MSFLKKLKRFIVITLVLVLAAAGIFVSSTLKKVNSALSELERLEIGTTRDELYISEEAYAAHEKNDNIVNIALFGRDIDQNDGLQRSDSIMIFSVNKTTGGIAITSIQRDTLVKIPGYAANKINMAYFNGGAPLAVQTLNVNLDMDISSFISVDLEALVDIVNAIGGLELNITETELPEMNAFIAETNGILGGEPSPQLNSAGTQLCDGRQTLVYARIRQIGNSDFDRTERQRIVLRSIYDKVKANLSYSTIMKILGAVSSHIQTNMTNTELMQLGIDVLRSKGEFTANSLCDEEYIRMCYLSDSGMQVLVPYYLEDMAEDLHKKLYGASYEYTPSNQLIPYSSYIKELTQYEELHEIDTGTTI